MSIVASRAKLIVPAGAAFTATVLTLALVVPGAAAQPISPAGGHDGQGSSESTSETTIGRCEPFHASQRNELEAIDVAMNTTGRGARSTRAPILPEAGPA